MTTLHLKDDGNVIKTLSVPFTTGNLDIEFDRPRSTRLLFGLQVNYDAELTVGTIGLFLSNDNVKWLDYTSANDANLTIVSAPASGSERETGITFSCLGFRRWRVRLPHSAGSPNVQAYLAW